MYPGVDYSKLAAQSVGSTGQFTQGIDPDWTALANAYGFIQNPFPKAGTEGQDQMRYLATLKNIMDAQLGGQNGSFAQMSPNNPIAAMPFGMRQWFAGASPLFQSIQGRMLMPEGQDNMMSNGYQFGGLDTSQSNALMQLLATARSGGEGTGANTPTNPIAEGTPATDGTAAAAAQVTGGNDTTNTPPANGGLPGAANTVQATQSPGSGAADIAAALQAKDGINAQGGVGGQQYGPAEVTPAGAVGTQVGNAASALGTTVKGIVDQVSSWDMNAKRALSNAILGK